MIGAVITFGNTGLIVKASGVLAWALGLYGLSAVAGGLTLMALTGQLGSPKLDENSCSAYAPGVRVFAGFQIVIFIVATMIFASAAIALVRAPAAHVV